MTTKTPLALALAALVLITATACNRNDDASGGTNNTPAPDATADANMPPAADPTAPAAGAMSQAEALAMVNAVNDHEVKAAEMAKSKNVTGPVLEYANLMQAEHGKNMTDTTALLQSHGGAPADGAMLTEQRAKAGTKRASLQALEGEAFARAYMDAMVTDHAETLALLDSQLIPAATDEAVRNHLTMTRQHVQQHHDRAREIQGQLGGAAGTTPMEGSSGQGGGTGQG
jgi:putative membrane protein